MSFKSIINKDRYSFLRKNEHLSSGISMLCVSGSYGYGTNTETSDIDIRGFALPTKREILLNRDFEQVEDRNTDTVIYSFGKIVRLLSGCNPNVIELLGLKPENYILLDNAAMQLIKNRSMFLSKLAINTFGGYANAQLRRLTNKSAVRVTQEDIEKFIMQTISHSETEFRNNCIDYRPESFKLYIDDSQKSDMDKELFIDLSLTHFPLRDFTNIISEMNNVIRMYNKTGFRNKNAILHDKLGKHMMHLVRLYYTCFDILEKGEIVTCRDAEHELLMSLRNGMYLNENNQPTQEFAELVNVLEKRLDYDKNNTALPDKPDYGKIDDFVYSIYEDICK